MVDIREARIYQPEEDAVLERFNRDYLPWIAKHGGEIGETAMQGDKTAEAVILRYQAFCGWLTDWALDALDSAIREWEKAQTSGTSGTSGTMKPRRVLH